MPGPGVKGRPAACTTCRRRKKGCDRQRPSCGQCRKACIPCGGYTSSPNQEAGGAIVPEPVATISGPDSTHASYVTSAASTAYRSPAPGPTAWSAELPLPMDPEDFKGKNTDTADPYYSPPGSSGDDYAVPAYGAYYGSGGHYLRPPAASQSMTLAVQPATTLRLARPAPFDQELPQHSYETHTSKTTASSTNSSTSNTTLDRHQLKLRSRLIQQHSNNVSPLHSGPLAHVATTDNLISQFWSAYLPNSRPFPSGTFITTFGSSLSAMDSHSQSNSGLRKGLLALGLTTVGRANGSKAVLEQGFRMYSDALHEVAHGLRNATGYSEEQLVAARLFGLYEAFFGTELQTHSDSARSWMLHASGEAALVTSNPPEAYIHGQAHRLFVAGRHHIALSALVHRKRTFLSEPAWKTIPWTEHPKSKRDHLLDIMVDYPSLIEGIEAMKTWKHPGKQEAYRKLLNLATEDITQRLLKWKEAHAVDIVPATLTEQLPHHLEPGVLANSHVMTMYYSTSIRTRNMHVALTPPGSSVPDVLDAVECCRQLIRGLRIFAHPDTGLFRQHIAPYPMSTALHFVSSMPMGEMVEERLALWDLLRSKECFPVFQFVMSMEPLQAKSLKRLEGVSVDGTDLEKVG